MDFIDEVVQFSKRCLGVLDKLQNEEATKQALILPFLQLLGYNVFDPHEVVPEFTADVGTKKGEKVDYVIQIDQKPAILLEAKPYGDNLTAHDTQLFRYFSVTEAKFAILTNGVLYKFYSDLQEPNKMDSQPFFEFDVLKPEEQSVNELKRFHKENFNLEDLSSAAVNLKYTTRIKQMMAEQLKEPSDDFVRFWLKDVYSGRLVQSVLDQFRPVVKRALSQYINDLISDRLKSAMERVDHDASPETSSANTAKEDVEESEKGQSRIATTDEELEAYHVIKAILRQAVAPSRITYKDTSRRFNILLDDNIRRWICRLFLGRAKKYIVLNEDQPRQVDIDSVDDIYSLADDILAVALALDRSIDENNTESACDGI